MIKKDEPFLMPTDKQLVEIAILFNDGILDKQQLANMVAMAEFILNRLHEHKNVSIKSSQEIEDENSELSQLGFDIG